MSAVEGNISTISTSKFYSESQYNDFKGVWVTLPSKREIEVTISGDLEAIDDLHPDIIDDVRSEIRKYFDLTR